MYAQRRKTESSKRLMRDLFDLKETSRPMFVPLIYRYASKISQVPVEEMLGNPNHLSRSLIMAQGLFGYDGIISSYDLHLEMEALGLNRALAGPAVQEAIEALRDRIAAGRLGEIVPKHARSLLDKGRIPAVLQSTAQLSEVVGREVPVIGVLSGPVTLLNRILYGDFAVLWREHRELLTEPLNDLRALVIELIKAYCEQHVDVIWLIEEDWAGVDAAELKQLRPFYRTFWNVTQYYDVKSILSFHSCNTCDAERYFALGADGIFFGDLRSRELPLSSLAKWAESYGVCVGLPCPYPEDEEQVRKLDDLVRAVANFGRGFFLSTPWEVPIGTPV
ncbi:MAG: hypothetical protein M1358_00190, partial [Chloroflexi bacterium]|nr:hypothetical protein [Chloroflexota bacterium]